VTDPFESYEKKINDLKDDIRDMRRGGEVLELLTMSMSSENRRLRDACRQTNKGITRLRRRCDSQTKKIAALKAALVEAFGAHSARGGEIKQSWIEAVEGRRPEKAT
jgi:predicted RNase H-like nuclease (RuvC/YqgF family)